MKIAIVHDKLTIFGGAERVLQSLLKIFPDANLYTSYADINLIDTYFPNLNPSKLHTSLLQKTPLKSHNSLLQLYSPFIWRSFNLEKYNIVISHSASGLCNLISVKRPFHIQYIQSPPKNLFNLAPKRKLQKIIPYTKFIAKYYNDAIHNTPFIIVNSKNTQKIMMDKFAIASKVIYPPVQVPNSIPKKAIAKYFISVSRLDKIKNLELAIKACNVCKLPFKIIGEATDKEYKRYLKSIAGPTVEFLGVKTDAEIDELYRSAIAFIFTSENEDFGISPVEAMAHGVPVISFYGGGLKETVIHKKTGLFFYEYSTQAIIKTLKDFSLKNFNPILIYNHAKKFNEARFTNNIKFYINNIN